jgi:hypothetical protein
MLLLPYFLFYMHVVVDLYLQTFANISSHDVCIAALLGSCGVYIFCWLSMLLVTCKHPPLLPLLHTSRAAVWYPTCLHVSILSCFLFYMHGHISVLASTCMLSS